MKDKISSLKRQQNPLSQPEVQLTKLEQELIGLPGFDQKLLESGIPVLKTSKPRILQVNVGKMCNQTCKHCHVDAGPDRKEIMTRETMQHCLQALNYDGIDTVDITGGAPEMNPEFRWFVEEIAKRGKKVLVRCNLTIINSNPKYYDLPEFYAKNNVEVISSLPHFAKIRTDAQRGDGVFDRSIKALRQLNEVGYGVEGSGLVLDLVYNPTGAFLPAGQISLEKEFKERLDKNYGVQFNQLFAITNMPVSRFLEYLISTDNLESYMETLVNAFNPNTLENLMCRDTLSVGWDGYLYDCDFNQMLELKIDSDKKTHISEIDEIELENRTVRTGRHCFGCTAGAGSSCGGEIA